MTIFYVPLEPIAERYTSQWSGAKTGWLERNWIGAGIPYHRIEGKPPASKHIKTGCVLDARGRSVWAFSQIEKILELGESKVITSSDVILFDDFWHPGMEALRYAFDQWNLKPKMFAFLHAQSVDCFDFTAPMANWMRHYERGNAAILDGIFTSCTFLADLIIRPKDQFGPICDDYKKVWTTGHPFSYKEVLDRMPYRSDLYMYHSNMIKPSCKRTNTVVYSSRWDREKDPLTFLLMAEKVLMIGAVPDVQFVVCTSAPVLRSNDPALLEALQSAIRRFPNHIILRENLTKEDYYGILQTSKVQFNCALQDFVAISLLEASVAGCFPIYPDFRSFPETFQNDWNYMYSHGDPYEAAKKVNALLSDTAGKTFWSIDALDDRAWIHERFADTWKYQYAIMKACSEGVKAPVRRNKFLRWDPTDTNVAASY